MAHESHFRSVIKTITWRVVASITTFSLAYFIFSQSNCDDVLRKSSLVAGLEMILKLAFYYLHERAWQKVPLGVIRGLFSSKK